MNQPSYTFIENRKCMHCGSPIADQLHKAQKFCSKETYSNGTTKNCKDQFWIEQRKQEKGTFAGMESYHRSCTDTLMYLYNLNGPEITLEILEQMGIDLGRSAAHRKVGSEQRFFYLGFYVSVNTNTNQTQIHPHNENLF